MGTINYNTSDYITLGIKPYSILDYEGEEMTENEILEEIELNYEADYENAKYILDNYSFYFYHITIKSGYYEGFYINIENNFPLFYNDHYDKREAQKEITEIKKMLVELAGVGFMTCCPGWCTSYKNYEETLKTINEAIKEMRNEAKFTPCYTTWAKSEIA